MSNQKEILEAVASSEYKEGFVTDVEQEFAPKGLTEDIIRHISLKKGEPEWMLEFRLKAFRKWQTMETPSWGHINLPKINYQDIIYFAAPKKKKADSLDPELEETFEKLGIPLKERNMLGGVAVDAVFDSVSVKTTFREKLAEKGIIFCSFSEAVRDYPDLVKKYLASVVPVGDNYFSALNSAVFSDGSFCYIPKNTRCPMELSSYFRINASGTGQFERTLIVADEGSYVSYLEGCTAPQRDESQLHAAVVEIVVKQDAEVKYSTVQNWYPGNKQGEGGIYQKRYLRRLQLQAVLGAGGNRFSHNLEIPEHHTQRRQFGQRVLQRCRDKQLPAGRYRNQDDPYREEHQKPHREQGHFSRMQREQLQRYGKSPSRSCRCEEPFPVRQPPARFTLRSPHLPSYRERQSFSYNRTRGHNFQNRRRPAVLLPATGYYPGRCGWPYSKRLCP